MPLRLVEERLEPISGPGALNGPYQIKISPFDQHIQG